MNMIKRILENILPILATLGIGSLCALFALCGAKVAAPAAEPLATKEPLTLSQLTPRREPKLNFDGAHLLTFQCGIVINAATGEVKIREDLKLDDASRKFWLALAESFPGVREAWLAGYKEGKKP
jgi:hypothetical protein